MTARIAGFISRAEAGLRKPDSVSYNVAPQRGGAAVHYGGDGAPPASHDGCVKRWRDWQAFHMDGRGWADIAYSFGFCNHGYVFEGRGWGRRTAANGTNDGNDRFLAYVWIGGGSSTPTPAALDALTWLILTGQISHNVGANVKPHSYFKSTGCPGSSLRAWVGASGWMSTVPPTRPAPKPAPMPDAPGQKLLYKGVYNSSDVTWAQQRLNAHGYRVTVDGDFGDATDRAVRKFQHDKGLDVDGIVGADTRRSLAASPAKARSGEIPPKFPLPKGWYFGPKSGPKESVSGYYGYSEDLKTWQRQMRKRGWKIKVDGLYGPETAEVTRAFQREKRLTPDGLIGIATWQTAWTAPIT